ncbi:uncharacterized protein LOC135204278 [Macrobrachium nipponense]|uniref:uncharacterized protein LOC135204278 n=1 Tax=Macrobrachium nipponense TaxID=159736 RepID=UPI0030C7A651
MKILLIVLCLITATVRPTTDSHISRVNTPLTREFVLRTIFHRNRGLGFNRTNTEQDLVAKSHHNNTDSQPCPSGLVLHVDGKCTAPVVTYNYYQYVIPSEPRPIKETRPIILFEPPKEIYNIMIIHLPEDDEESEPVVILPPQQKSVIYILRKESNRQGQHAIQVPESRKTKPKLFLITYRPETSD